MTPVAAPELEALADRYCQFTAPQLRGRVERIKFLLRRAIDSYAQRPTASDGRLIALLFFDDSASHIGSRAGELLDRVRRELGAPSESRFREWLDRAMQALAGFLIDFVMAVQPRPEAVAAPGGVAPPPAADQVAVRSASASAASPKTWASSQVEAVLRFSLEDPGGSGHLTIDEHRQIIAVAGACWWGWFRSEHEEDQRQAIAQRLGGSGCEVALWERSEGHCYIARCEEVAVANDADMPSPDPVLTPDYYRSSRWPAWLKFTAISDANLDELPGRFGDEPEPTSLATIFLSPEPAREPLVIPAAGRSILHLSGLRFGRTHRWSTAVNPRPRALTAQEAIASVLTHHQIDATAIGLVVICGNFAAGDPSEPAYGEALAFVDGLAEQLPSVRRDHVVVVPGSDDFARPGDRALASQTLYRQFHHRLYGDDYGRDITRLRRYEFADFHLNVLPVNTVKMLGVDERDEGMFGHGYDGQLYAMEADYRRSRAAGRRAINIVVGHHHLVPTLAELPATAAEASVMDRLMPGIHDGRSLLEKLARHRVRLFLHGHLPEPDGFFVSAADGWQTAVCGAGTAGAAEWWLRTKYRTHVENAIAVYDVEDSAIRVRLITFGERYHDHPARDFRLADQPVPVS